MGTQSTEIVQSVQEGVGGSLWVPSTATSVTAQMYHTRLTPSFCDFFMVPSEDLWVTLALPFFMVGANMCQLCVANMCQHCHPLKIPCTLLESDGLLLDVTQSFLTWPRLLFLEVNLIPDYYSLSRL